MATASLVARDRARPVAAAYPAREEARPSAVNRFTEVQVQSLAMGESDIGISGVAGMAFSFMSGRACQ